MHPQPLESQLAKAAAVVCKQGMVPFPVSAAAIEIIRRVVGNQADELDLICAFDQAPSQTLDQLTAASAMDPETVAALASRLARKGLIFNQPNSAGVMVYRLLPFMAVGLMEYRFMGALSGSREEKELAALFEELMDHLRDQVQGNYDALLPFFQNAPALDRTVPAVATEDGGRIKVIAVDKKLDQPEEFVLPSQSVAEIIAKFDDIAVGYCFCRQRRGLLGEPCATQAPTLNCFTFGKSARHTVAQGFARQITKTEALKIMAEAEAAGLVHKAFHPASRESSSETSICNCCKDCCDTIRLWKSGTMPLVNSTFHLAVIDAQACTGCGICAERCPTDAIVLNADGIAQRDQAACFGCGVCARFCPAGAIALQEGLRKVCIAPPRIRATAPAAGV
jgi:Pyruvate/2-oxoacid:ferredoxin oxidoreductase delta subunit